jgi:hypothetical protein
MSGIASPSGQGVLSDILLAQDPLGLYSVDSPVLIKSPVSPWPGTSGTTYGKPTVSEAWTRFYEAFRKESVDFDKKRKSHDTEYNLILLVVRPLINAASFPRMWLIPDPRPLSARQTSPPLSNTTKIHRSRKSSVVRRDDVKALHPTQLILDPTPEKPLLPHALAIFSFVAFLAILDKQASKRSALIEIHDSSLKEGRYRARRVPNVDKSVVIALVIEWPVFVVNLALAGRSSIHRLPSPSSSSSPVPA